MKFYVLQRDYLAAEPKKQFHIQAIVAVDKEDAWNLVNDKIATSNSQEWLMTKGEVTALKKVLRRQG